MVLLSQLNHFDKSIKELTYPDAALLAALTIKAPSKYNSYRFPEIGKNLEEISFIKIRMIIIIYRKMNFIKFKNSNLNLKKKIQILTRQIFYNRRSKKISANATKYQLSNRGNKITRYELKNMIKTR